MIPRRAGFSLVELLIAVAIIGVLVALTLMAVTHARSQMRSTQCLNNLRQLSLGVRMYTDQHAARMPDSEDEPWYELIHRFLEEESSVLRCPADPHREDFSSEASNSNERDDLSCSYAYRDETVCFPEASFAGRKIDHLAAGYLVMVFDAAPHWHTPDLINIARVNSSAESMEYDDFEDNLMLDAETGTFLGLAFPPGEVPTPQEEVPDEPAH